MDYQKKIFESEKPRVNGAIGNSFTNNPSSWRSEQPITSWLKEHKVPFSGGFDVRSITSHLRDSGSSMFAMGTGVNSTELMDLLNTSVDIVGDKSALKAGRGDYDTAFAQNKIGIIDLGAKQSIINVVENNGFETLLLNPEITADEILSLNLIGLIISNGPGDPRSLVDVVSTVKNLIGKLPLFGICLGHQILSLACDLNVSKLNFGHHGSNHPVKSYVESKKHLSLPRTMDFQLNLAVIKKNIPSSGEIEQYAVNLNDGSNEGISIWESNAYSVQFHPESGPGTTDGLELFNPFFKMIREKIGS